MSLYRHAITIGARTGSVRRPGTFWSPAGVVDGYLKCVRGLGTIWGQTGVRIASVRGMKTLQGCTSVISCSVRAMGTFQNLTSIRNVCMRSMVTLSGPRLVSLEKQESGVFGSNNRLISYYRRQIVQLDCESKRTFFNGFNLLISRGLHTAAVDMKNDKNTGGSSEDNHQQEEIIVRGRSAGDRDMQSLSSVSTKVEYSLEKYYKRDDVSTDAILIYNHQELHRYQAFYTLSAALYAADILGIYLSVPPPDVRLLEYFLYVLGEHGVFSDLFTTCVVALPFSMALWTWSLKLVRRQFRAVYYHPGLQQYIGVSYTWRWGVLRREFTQDEVMALVVRAAGWCLCLQMPGNLPLNAALLLGGRVYNNARMPGTVVRQASNGQTLPRVFCTDKMTDASILVYHNRHNHLHFLHLNAIGTYGGEQYPGDAFTKFGFKNPKTVKKKCYAFMCLLIGIVLFSRRSFVRIYYTPSSGAYTGMQALWNTNLDKVEFFQNQLTSRQHIVCRVVQRSKVHHYTSTLTGSPTHSSSKCSITYEHSPVVSSG